MVVEGWVDRRFEPVREVFQRVVDEQAGTGAAVAGWAGGSWVVDLWGGGLWQRNSLVQPYSVSKPFVAVGGLLLGDRGVLGSDAPVGRVPAGGAPPGRRRPGGP